MGREEVRSRENWGREEKEIEKKTGILHPDQGLDLSVLILLTCYLIKSWSGIDLSTWDS